MINIYDYKDNVICSVIEEEFDTVLNQLRKVSTVYVDLPNGFYEFPKYEDF